MYSPDTTFRFQILKIGADPNSLQCQETENTVTSEALLEKWII